MAANNFTGASSSNWNLANNWSLGVVPTATDTNIATFLVTSPACTINVASVCNNVDFTGYTNTITFTNTLTISGNVTLGASMNFAGSAALIVSATCNMTSNGKTCGVPLTFTHGTTGKTFTLLDNWTVAALVTTTAATGALALTINGFSLFCQAGITFNTNVNSSSSTVGTTNIVLTGTGNLTPSGNGSSIRNNITINAPGSTITWVGTNNFIYNTGTFTYIAGTIIVTGTGTFNVSNTATLDFSSTNIFEFPILLSISGGTTTLLSDIYINKGFTVTNTVICNGFNIYLRGGTKSVGGTITGSTTLIISGNSGASSVNYSSTGTMRINCTINTLGTVVFANSHTLSGTWTYIQGTLTGSSTHRLDSTVTYNTSGTTIAEIPIVLQGNASSVTVTLLSDFYTSKGITSGAGVTLTINSFNMYITSGVLTPGGSAITGTATLILSGSNSSSIVTWSGNSVIKINTTINTPGTIILSGTIAYNTGTLTYTAGTVQTTGTILNISTNTTLNTNGMAFNNIALTVAGITITLNSLLTVVGTLSWPAASIGIVGTGGFYVGTLSVTGVTGNTLTLGAGATYTVINAFNVLSTGSRWNLKTNNAGVQATFTLAQGATQNVQFATVTDIDSSQGQTIWSWSLISSNTNNWNNLIFSSLMSTSNIYFN